ncbi:MAG: class D sortase [Candidatus Saccharimonadales bacterium]
MSQAPNELPLPQQDQPTNTPAGSADAVSLIRQKVASVYGDEPSAKEEEKEIESLGATSKHQEFIAKLMNSGKSLVEVQTAWHLYYQNLPDREKHEVWQEFYANHARSAHKLRQHPSVEQQGPPKHTPHVPLTHTIGHVDAFNTPDKRRSTKSADDLKKQLLTNVTGGGKLKKKHHIQSLLFGLGMGAFVIFIFMFGFFNERFVAPFITPSRTVSNTPIIVDPTASNAVGPESKVIIPKINVEVPVVYDVPSISEKDMQTALERGVVHYPQSPVPGQNGNVVVVGHSSNNIFNNGKYKFAFVLLSKLEVGDTFMLNYGGQRYIYKIYEKKVVSPTDVSVLGPTDKVASATLITCDPPGTALRRLIIIGEQISPSTNNNVAANPVQTSASQPAVLPGNAESLFHRLFGWLYDNSSGSSN